jgi:pimeloyl-ACP methyl ester carboxylesterase
VVLLLHGWSYDIHSYVDVAPLLASAGYRVIVPYLRGYGTTRFLSSETVRNGQQSVVALDITALMDAFKIEKATIAGFDSAHGLLSKIVPVFVFRQPRIMSAS